MNTFHLSEVDGNLYRNNERAPLRKGLLYWPTKIRTTNDLKAAIRAGDRMFGGRSLVLILNDGGTLCAKCTRDQFAHVLSSVRDKDNNGWRAVAATNDGELEPCECVHCYEPIANA